MPPKGDEAFQRRDENILDDVIDKVGPRRKPQPHVGVHRVDVAGDESGSRLAIALQDLLDQAAFARIGEWRRFGRRARIADTADHRRIVVKTRRFPRGTPVRTGGPESGRSRRRRCERPRDY